MRVATGQWRIGARQKEKMRGHVLLLAVVGCASQCSCGLSTLVLLDARATWGEVLKESESREPGDWEAGWARAEGGLKGLAGLALGSGRRLQAVRLRPAATLNCRGHGWHLSGVAFAYRHGGGSSDFQKKVRTQLYSPFAATKRCFRGFSMKDEGILKAAGPFLLGGALKGSVKWL